MIPASVFCVIQDSRLFSFCHMVGADRLSAGQIKIRRLQYLAILSLRQDYTVRKCVIRISQRSVVYRKAGTCKQRTVPGHIRQSMVFCQTFHAEIPVKHDHFLRLFVIYRVRHDTGHDILIIILRHKGFIDQGGRSRRTYVAVVDRRFDNRPHIGKTKRLSLIPVQNTVPENYIPSAADARDTRVEIDAVSVRPRHLLRLQTMEYSAFVVGRIGLRLTVIYRITQHRFPCR